MKHHSLLAGVVALLLLAVSALSYYAGVNRTLARTAYVHSISIQEEAKCYVQNDLRCLQANWKLRAAITAEEAKRATSSWLPGSMEPQLAAYIEWARNQPNFAAGIQ